MEFSSLEQSNNIGSLFAQFRDIHFSAIIMK